MNITFIKTIKNDFINLPAACLYSPILTIDKKLTEEEIKEYVEDNCWDIIKKFIDELYKSEKNDPGFNKYLEETWRVDFKNETAMDDYEESVRDAFLEKLSEYPEVIIQPSAEDSVRFILY